jgi:hypothetical protein
MADRATLEIVTRIIMDAGNILLRGYHDSTQEITKTSSIDIVTETDREAEAYIVGELTRHFPTHHIVGEEGGGVGADRATAPYRWYVDPIDGTTNSPTASRTFAPASPSQVATMCPSLVRFMTPVVMNFIRHLLARVHGSTVNQCTSLIVKHWCNLC